MATLVFDIATVGAEWSALSAQTRHNLTRFKTHEEAEAQLGLSPLTGTIVNLGVYDVERGEGVVYGVGAADTASYRQRTEAELLEDFWEGARSYDVFVTYGGRRFDVPYLYHRSIALGVRPSVEFPRVRQPEKQSLPYHVDLHDEFSFRGDLRVPTSLHLLCEAYGMESPDHGEVTGETVGECFWQEKFADLARYTEANVTATAQLYEKWLQNLAPASFLNVLTEV